MMSQAIPEHRGGGRTSVPLSPVPSIATDISKPWAIVHSPPKQKPEIAQRYFNRQDAEDSLRFLKRYVQHPQNFSIAFLGDEQ